MEGKESVGDVLKQGSLTQDRNRCWESGPATGDTRDTHTHMWLLNISLLYIHMCPRFSCGLHSR